MKTLRQWTACASLSSVCNLRLGRGTKMSAIRTAAVASLLLATFSAHAAPTDVTGSGSGFFVNADGWIVTNAHVLEGCAKATIPSLGEMTDWKVDKENDLAAARLVGPAPKATLPLRHAPPRLGEDVAAFGYPLATMLSESVKVTTGNINSLTGLHDDTRYLQISTPIQPGNSGGPLVDRGGAVLGITTAVLALGVMEGTGALAQNVNFAVRGSVLETFLQSRGVAYVAGEAAAPPLATADLADKVAPGVVQVFCHGAAPTVAMVPPAPERPPAPQPAPSQSVSLPDRNFRALDRHDAIGFDYQTLKNVSQYECQAACEGDTLCKATTYNKAAHVCFLKSSAALIVRNGDAAATVAGELASSVSISTFTIGAGHDMAGGDYAQIRHSNFIGCYLACEQDTQCIAFAFVRKQKTCWLKGTLGSVSVKAGVDLGIR